MGVFWRSVALFVLIVLSAAHEGDHDDVSGGSETETQADAVTTTAVVEEAATTTVVEVATTAVVEAATTTVAEVVVKANTVIWPTPRADCDDYTGAQCCDVNGNETNAECWFHMKWAKENMGDEAHLSWYVDWGVTKENSASLTNTQMQCILWELAKSKTDLMDKYPSSNHHCPRPCLAAEETGGVKCVAGATTTTEAPKVEEPAVTEAPTPEPLPASTGAPPKEEENDSLSMPLWAIILISLVAIGAIIAGVIFYLSNDKSPQKKKKKRGGLTTPAPPKKAPEQEPPAPVVATAAPIYTTAAPLTYTAAAPVSASSFVYAPQPMITTGVPGSVYQAGPVVTHATPIATSQPIYQMQPGGASVM